MKKVIKLTESDLVRIIKRVISESSENEKLFRKFKAPEKITIKITEKGKGALEKIFRAILKNLQPKMYREKQPEYFPNVIVNFVDKITLEKKYYAELSKGDKSYQFRIGSMRIDQSMEGRWNFTGNDNYTTDIMEMYVFYLPYEGRVVDDIYKKDNEGAYIQIRAGINIDSSQAVGNFDPYEKGDYFDKIEVGEVSEKGYFEIVGVESTPTF